MHRSATLREAAREASLVLIARQTSADLKNVDDGSDLATKSSKETYQEALTLLQDPLLPVRAQGLSMLRHLVELSVAPTSGKSQPTQSIEPALIPAILDIFINSVQNEDSFIFLNAVQGLAAMVRTFGKQVFQNLLNIYVTDSSMAATLSKQELDVKLRIGEALNEIIGKCGQSLGGYGQFGFYSTIHGTSIKALLQPNF